MTQNGKHLERTLECKVRVMRVAKQEKESVLGVGFRIEDYHFAHTQVAH